MALVPPSTASTDVWSHVRRRLEDVTNGRYEVLRLLGEGGMAAVFLARHLALDRRVAIKVMAPGLLTTSGMIERFLAEARTVARFRCQNIVQVLDVEQAPVDLYFIVMEYIEGCPLDRVLRAHGPLPLDLARAILYDTGQGLAYAHRNKVLHRDVKPANIMLDLHGQSILMDFGIAKHADSDALTQSGARVGTPAYMSPEQCAGRPLSFASDQYALGIVAYEMLSGRPPFEGRSFEVQAAHVTQPPPLINVAKGEIPAEVASALDRMLHKDPELRWPSISDALDALGCTPLAAGDDQRARLTEMVVRLQTHEGDAESLRPSRGAAPRIRTPSPPVREAAGKGATAPRWPHYAVIAVSLFGSALLAAPKLRSVESASMAGAAMGASEVDRGVGVSDAAVPNIDSVTRPVSKLAPSLRAPSQKVDSILRVEVMAPSAGQVLTVGDTVVLSARTVSVTGHEGSDGIEWSVADSAIAVVRGSGLLVGRTPGRVQLRALATSGHIEARRMLEVVARPEPVLAKKLPDSVRSVAANPPVATSAPTSAPARSDTAVPPEPPREPVLRAAIAAHAALLARADLGGLRAVYPLTTVGDRNNFAKLEKLLTTREYQSRFDAPVIGGAPTPEGPRLRWSYSVSVQWRNNFGAFVRETLTFDVRFEQVGREWQLTSARLTGKG